MQITHYSNQPVQTENHWSVNDSIAKARAENTLSSVALLHYAAIWFNLLNDPKFQLQPSYNLKWQLYYLAHSKKLDNGDIQTHPNFGYFHLSLSELALLYFILSSFQDVEKNEKGDEAVFSSLVSYLEHYIFNLSKDNESASRELLDAFISFDRLAGGNNPEISDKVRVIKEKLEQVIEGNKSHNSQSPFLALPDELLQRIVVYVGDPKLTVLVCKRFQKNTYSASLEFLKPFRAVEMRAIERLLLTEGDLDDKDKHLLLQRCYAIFMRRATRNPNWKPDFQPGNPSLVNIPLSSLSCVRAINDKRQLFEDKELVDFFKIYPNGMNLFDLSNPNNVPQEVLARAFQECGFLALKLLDSDIQYVNADVFMQAVGVLPLSVEDEELVANLEEQIRQDRIRCREFMINNMIANGNGMDFDAIVNQIGGEEILNLQINDSIGFLVEQYRNLDGERLLEGVSLEIHQIIGNLVSNSDRIEQLRNRPQRISVEAGVIREYLGKNATALAQRTELSFMHMSFAARGPGAWIQPSALPSDLFYHLPNLRKFDIAHMAFSQLPDEFFDLENLEILNIRECRLTSLQGLSRLQNLRKLRLNVGGSQTLPLPREIFGLQNLRVLNIGGNTHWNLDSLPPQIGQMRNLKVLDILGISGFWPIRLLELPNEMKQLTNLRELRIYQGQIPQEQLDALQQAIPGLQVSLQ